MTFNITAVIAKSNRPILYMETHYLPRLNEEIEFDSGLYVVKYVRYQIQTGSCSSQNVKLGLECKEDWSYLSTRFSNS